MPGITSVAQEFADFAAWLGEKSPEKIQRIGTLNNGFEGWLKLEFFFWLTSHRQEMLRSAGSDDDADVGLEYNLRRDQRHPALDRESNRSDLWIRDSQGSRFHYVELKAPFANLNEVKVLTSVGNGFWHMARIRKASERAASGNAVVLGVSFDEERWRDCINRVRHYADLPVDTVLSGEGVLGRDGLVRWCVLTKVYGGDNGKPNSCE
jgi:hypothetical protein